MTSTTAQALRTRLDAVERRLAEHAGSPAPAGLTAPDPPTGERWEAGQVWAHLAEICPYWVGQVGMLSTASSDEPVPFGRTKRDAGRIAAIELGRARSPAEQWPVVRQGIAATRQLLDDLDATAFERIRGRHETLGVMPLERILDEFLVGHLEQHADQLDGLASGG